MNAPEAKLPSAELQMLPPRVKNDDADQEFRTLLRANGSDPGALWTGGYVDYEWSNGRHLITSYARTMKGQRVLEFGCNYGATAIVLSHLGMDVVAVDTQESLIAAARLNSRRYGAEHIDFLRVSEREPLPFNDSEFDLITCNSVLEYVDPNVLGQRLWDFDRLLRPGGTLLVMGTSNRLAFREIHSRRYFVNYLPPSFDRFFGSVKPFQRGIWPWTIRNRFPDYQDLVLADWGSGIVSAKRAKNVGQARIILLHMLRFVCGTFSISVGSILPNIFMALRKPGPDLKKVSQSDSESSNLIHQTNK